LLFKAHYFNSPHRCLRPAVKWVGNNIFVHRVRTALLSPPAQCENNRQSDNTHITRNQKSAAWAWASWHTHTFTLVGPIQAKSRRFGYRKRAVAWSWWPFVSTHIDFTIFYATEYKNNFCWYSWFLIFPFHICTLNMTYTKQLFCFK